MKESLPPVGDDEIRTNVARGKQYTMVFLLEGPARDQDDASAARIQQEHLRHLFSLMKAGKLLVNGPVLDDGRLRGVSIYDTTDLVELQSWLEADPAYQAGRLVYEIRPWFGIPGSTLT